MTRLVEEDINTLADNMTECDKLFFEQTGMTLEEAASLAVGFNKSIKKRKAEVIPVTSGLGIIGGFSESVAAILRHVGVLVNVSKRTDVSGLFDAYENDSEIAFLADDDVCAAFGIGSRVHSDNGYATGRGFAASLIGAMKKRKCKVENKKILVIGAGPVGRAAADYVLENNALPVIYDINYDKAVKNFSDVKNVEILKEVCIKDYKYIINAATEAELIKKSDVTEETIIAAPGMPLGVSKEASKIATVIHNPLELGIITMYFDCMKQIEERGKSCETDGRDSTREKSTLCA